jgi:anti-sigma factor RsiW
MSCNQTQSLLSVYLDGQVTGKQMQGVAQHLASCDQCHARFRGLQQAQQLLAAVGRRKAPPELALRLRLALSREASRSPRRRLQGLLVQVEDALNSFMVPATAGVLSAIIFFGVLMGFFAMPQPLQASDDAIPAFYTRAELKSSHFDINMDNAPGSVLVEAVVGPNGRVQDYRIISGNDSAQVNALLKNVLIFTEFQPAMQFGRPTTDRVILSFSKINVKG